MLKDYFKDIDFIPLNNYIETIEPIIQDYNVKQERIWTDINCQLNNGLDLNVIMLKDNAKIWITFYYKREVILEKVEFMILRNSVEDIDRTIRHDYYVIENDILTTCNSFYAYLGNECKKGVESIRKVYLKDVKKGIFYDNLNNLTISIDNSNIPILFKKESNNIELNIKTMVLEPNDYKPLVKNLNM